MQSIGAAFGCLLFVLIHKHTKLNKKHCVDRYNSRVRRSIVEKAQKDMAACRKLKVHLCNVECYRITRYSTDTQKMRCVVGISNNELNYCNLKLFYAK